jgi:hypothetical protein
MIFDYCLITIPTAYTLSAHSLPASLRILVAHSLPASPSSASSQLGDFRTVFTCVTLLRLITVGGFPHSLYLRHPPLTHRSWGISEHSLPASPSSDPSQLGDFRTFFTCVTLLRLRVITVRSLPRVFLRRFGSRSQHSILRACGTKVKK